MLEENEIYRDLQRHLDRLPIGFPTTESGLEIRILRHLFSPREAQVALQLSMVPETIDKIYKRVKNIGTSRKELQEILDKMVRRAVFNYRREVLRLST